MSITTILPLISAIFILYLGSFVLYKNRKAKLNIIFTLFCLSIFFWFFGTFMMFSSKEAAGAVFWDRFVYAGVVFVPSLMYHISLVFSKKKEGKMLFLGYILSFVFLILSRTDYFVSGLYEYSWGYHTQARFFHHIFLLFFSVYLSFFYFNIYKFSKTSEKILERIQAKNIFYAYVILLIGAMAYLPAYGIDIFPIAYISGLIFAMILAYTIIRYQLMELRVVLAEFFVGLVALVLLIQILTSTTASERLFNGLLLIIFSFFGYLLIKTTIQETERRNEIQKLYQEVDKLSETKSEFLSIASHQLRTPLSAIKGYISLILEGDYGKLPKKIKQPLENVYQSNERLIKLVNDLLNLSRLEAGKIDFTPEMLSLKEMILSIVEELKINAEKNSLYLKIVDPPEELIRISADKEKLRQVILNLIDNAIKYTKKGGITLRIEDSGIVQRIIISDTGEGMTQKEIKSLFHMFTRATAGTQMHTEGSGVGLYVAKKFIDMHNGRIWVESQGKGKGSTFYIELPRKTN